MTSPARRIGEFELIDRYFRPLAGRAGLGLADDVALLAPEPGHEWAVTTDAIVEGFDFFPEDPPEAIAARALRVNLSDLAAKGAEPFAYLLALGLRDDWTEAWIARFAAGLARDQGRYGIDLIGGDTGRGGERTTITVTAFGRVPAGTMVHRDGAAPGDVVLVTGTIGDSALGLRLRRGLLAMPDGPDRDHLLRRYLVPEPRTAVAAALRASATAAMDVSDGLLGDLARLCAASGVTATVEAGRVPLSAGAAALFKGDPSLLAPIFTGGEDYEILCTMRPDAVAGFTTAAAAAGVSVTAIGQIAAGDEPPAVTDGEGNRLDFATLGHDHFAS